MPKLYDIQGTPIKVGSLVAFYFAAGMCKARVTARTKSALIIEDFPYEPEQVLVLEEPVWPNK